MAHPTLGTGKLDMSRAWTEATGLVGTNRDLVSVLAGLFLFLPMFILLTSLLGSNLDVGASGGEPDPEQLAAQFNAVLAANWWALLLAMIGPLCAEITILALLGDRTRPTVREVLGRVPRLVLPMFAAQIMVGLVKQAPLVLAGILLAAAPATGFFLALPIAFFLSVKLTLTSAVIVIDGRANPLAAMRDSWRLTAGNAGRLMAFFAVLIGLALVIGLLLVLVAGLVFSALGERVALIGNAAFAALLLATYYTISHALTAAIHRQLTHPAPERAAEPFE